MGWGHLKLHQGGGLARPLKFHMYICLLFKWILVLSKTAQYQNLPRWQLQGWWYRPSAASYQTWELLDKNTKIKSFENRLRNCWNLAPRWVDHWDSGWGWEPFRWFLSCGRCSSCENMQFSKKYYEHNIISILKLGGAFRRCCKKRSMLLCPSSKSVKLVETPRSRADQRRTGNMCWAETSWFKTNTHTCQNGERFKQTLCNPTFVTHSPEHF